MLGDRGVRQLFARSRYRDTQGIDETSTEEENGEEVFPHQLAN